MDVLEMLCVTFLPPLVYALIFTNGFVPRKLRVCFGELLNGFFVVHFYVLVAYFWISLEINEPWIDWFMGAVALFIGILGLRAFFLGAYYSGMGNFQKTWVSGSECMSSICF